MAHKNREKYFWASYTDLMTSLFFVMLVLYVLTYALFQVESGDKEKAISDYQNMANENKYYADRYREIERVEQSVRALEGDSLFVYNEEQKVLIMTDPIKFATDSDVIPATDEDYLTRVGKSVYKLVEQQSKNDLIEDDIKFVVIIEGTASKDNATEDYNYRLSYRRAYSLYKFWKNKAGIEFDKEITQLILAGSGTGGTFRAKGDEKLNQRFLIQIIPKITAK